MCALWIAHDARELLAENPLASGFQIKNGEVNVTVPAVDAGDNYIVVRTYHPPIRTMGARYAHPDYAFFQLSVTLATPLASSASLLHDFRRRTLWCSDEIVNDVTVCMDTVRITPSWTWIIHSLVSQLVVCIVSFSRCKCSIS